MALSQKSDYDELTDKERAVVDAAAEHPQKRTPKEIAEIASEGGVAVSPSYTSRILREREAIIEDRLLSRLNERSEGRVTTADGDDPFQHLDRELDAEDEQPVQYIGDRPVKRTADADDRPADERTVSVELDRSAVEDVLAARAPVGLYEQLLDRLFEAND